MVFEDTGGSWTQIGDSIDGEAADDFSGGAIALSADGNRLVIGATSNDANGSNSGHVRVYEMDGGDWTQLGSDIDGEAMLDWFGASVGISSDGKRVAVGAKFSDGNGSSSGRVQIFEFTGEDWVQLGVNIDGEAADDISGHSVSLSHEGNTVAIGAYRNDGNGDDAGHVRVYGMFPVPVEEIGEENTFEISPNPTNGKIQILGFEYESIKIMDGFGRTLTEEKTYQPEIDISALPSGVYFIQIGSKNQSVTKRIIKE